MAKIWFSVVIETDDEAWMTDYGHATTDEAARDAITFYSSPDAQEALRKAVHDIAPSTAPKVGVALAGIWK